MWCISVTTRLSLGSFSCAAYSRCSALPFLLSLILPRSRPDAWASDVCLQALPAEVLRRASPSAVVYNCGLSSCGLALPECLASAHGWSLQCQQLSRSSLQHGLLTTTLGCPHLSSLDSTRNSLGSSSASVR